MIHTNNEMGNELLCEGCGDFYLPEDMIDDKLCQPCWLALVNY